ncbi:MAG: putative DNA binding domain-containing protein [Oscillospiraceae bacterium]|jgi:ATP-dependent DNA helicase RecG|nr:putative DNA binding domain-containing protein [Oscillospiraceae bacterium]
MLPLESGTVEYKSVVVDDIRKCVVAFANSGGGTLYVGIADDGDIIGLTNANEDMLNINNMLRDGVKPDVTLFVHSQIDQINNVDIVKITIQGGTERPYYLVGKGIRPEGVYVRHGAASVPATDTAIRKMIRETDGDSYEKLRSVEQNLTFDSAKVEFAKRKVEFGTSQMTTLGMINADKIYTNLALLLSEQCLHTIKTAIFQDTTQQIFKDRHEFGGSLFKQINDVYDYLDLNNKTTAIFDKLLRIDNRDYPETALREALLNAVVHREYSTSGSILIKVFADRIEFISPGGLVNGIEIGDIMSGYSACRNSELADVFYRLQFIEAYGTGILKIFEAYKTSLVQPKIEITPNVFKMILPNLNSVTIVDEAINPEESIMEYVFKNGSITRKQAESLLGLSQTATGKIFRKLVEQDRLTREGHSRNIRYFVSK